MDTERYRQLARTYKRVTWFGIFLNSFFIFPLLLFPRPYLALLGLQVEPIIWAMLPGMLLLWISIFYIPPTLDLKRYRVYAWLAIFPSRAGGATFCLGAVFLFHQPVAFLSIGLVDLFILSWQLWILLRIRDVEQPLPATAQAHRARWWRGAGIAAVVLAAAGGALAWFGFYREVDQRLATMEERFKYGSIGTEAAAGVPYWIWLTLPRIFPEYLPGPGGYNALGLHTERGKDVPVGFSVKTIGFARVGINCALCHTASVRFSPAESPRLLLGGASSTFDALGYQRFLFASASDPRFNAETIVGEIDRVYRLSFPERLLYRWVLVPATRKALLEQKAIYAWTQTRPPWGPGRIDPFNPVKAGLLQVDVGETLGNSDMMPIWNLATRGGTALHWDGLNTDVTEVVRSSALGDGATRKSIPLKDLEDLQGWLSALKPPSYPADRFPVDQIRAVAGSTLYATHCAACHAQGGARTASVVPLGEVGTDPHRSRMWTTAAAQAYNDYAKREPWAFKHFRSTDGYLAPPLDGLWTRAPYLHNGSVPTLRDLLEPPDQRPRVFFRGYDLFDAANVGFVSQGPAAERTGFRYDTMLPGNSNAGHLWGTTLSGEEKQSLIEFLKTL